ncbi:MAG: hypothetical protein ACRYGI_13880 [Janthinobacterium lividum]
MTEPPIETDADGIHARPPRIGHRWADLILALSAITISVISLFVAIDHGRTEEKLVTASTWPFLIYSANHTSASGADHKTKAIEFSIRNAGVGPAHIQSIVISFNGKPVRSAGELLTACCGFAGATVDDRIAGGETSERSILGVLPAREEIDFLGAQELPNDDTLRQALNTSESGLSFSACYCSVLDKCWTSNLKNTSIPKPVDQCVASADDYHD